MPELVSIDQPGTTGVSSRTTIGVFLRQAEASPNRPMLHFYRDGTWKNTTWAQAREAIIRIAAALAASGVRPGDRVVIMSDNRFEWILSDLAIQMAGGITVPIYPTLTAGETNDIIADCGATLLLVGNALRDKVRTGDGRAVLSFEDDVASWTTNEASAAMAAVVGDRALSLGGDDVATIIYTSGTTGTPKGVVITHESIVAMAEAGGHAFQLGADDVLLSFLPYSHVFERVEGIMAPLSAGATIWISRGAQFLAQDMQAVRPTLMLAVPRVLEKMMTAISDGIRKRPLPARLLFRVARPLIAGRLRARVTGGRLRFIVSGGAPLRADVERFFWSIGIPVYQGWGLTETTAAVTANRPGAIRHGTVGQPLPGVSVRTGTDGELLVKGPGVMREYHGEPQATSAVFADGWLRTGDVGAIDEEGFVTITDRKKDLIKTSGGKYVAPQPIEAQLQSFRYIAAAVLVGDQRPYIVALIQPDWDELRQQLKVDGSFAQLAQDDRVQQLVKTAVDTINGNLAKFEAIKRFRIVSGEFSQENGALTPSLKVRRQLVQQRYQQLIDDMYGT